MSTKSGPCGASGLRTMSLLPITGDVSDVSDVSDVGNVGDLGDVSDPPLTVRFSGETIAVVGRRHGSSDGQTRLHRAVTHRG